MCTGLQPPLSFEMSLVTSSLVTSLVTTLVTSLDLIDPFLVRFVILNLQNNRFYVKTLVALGECIF